MNGRIDTLQSAILLAKLQLFEAEVEARQRIGARYSQQLQAAGVRTTPQLAPGTTSVYAQYTIQVDHRQAVQDALMLQGIPTAVHYPTLLCQQPAIPGCRERCGSTCGASVAKRASERVLSLPMHPYLSEADQDRVVAAVAAATARTSPPGQPIGLNDTPHRFDACTLLSPPSAVAAAPAQPRGADRRGGSGLCGFAAFSHLCR